MAHPSMRKVHPSTCKVHPSTRKATSIHAQSHIHPCAKPHPSTRWAPSIHAQGPSIQVRGPPSTRKGASVSTIHTQPSRHKHKFSFSKRANADEFAAYKSQSRLSQYADRHTPLTHTPHAPHTFHTPRPALTAYTYSASSSACQPTWSRPSRYRFSSTVLNVHCGRPAAASTAACASRRVGRSVLECGESVRPEYVSVPSRCGSSAPRCGTSVRPGCGIRVRPEYVSVPSRCGSSAPRWHGTSVGLPGWWVAPEVR
eukprot:364251-Chlamydomonas_euryale.AAC.6